MLNQDPPLPKGSTLHSDQGSMYTTPYDHPQKVEEGHYLRGVPWIMP